MSSIMFAYILICNTLKFIHIYIFQILFGAIACECVVLCISQSMTPVTTFHCAWSHCSLLGWQEVQLCLMVFQVVPIRDEMSLTFTRLVCAVHKWLHFSTTMTAHTWALSSKPGRFCPPAQAVAPRRCCPPDSKREFWEISLLWLLCGESYEPRKVCRVRWNSQDGEKRYRLHLYTIVQFF